MLQHNVTSTGRRAHVAHAAVVGLHTVCCGAPALLLALSLAAGTTTGLTLASDYVVQIHSFVHRYEGWVLALSAALVVAGGAMEVQGRRSGARGFPWLFAISVLCLAVNAIIILAHRAG